MFRWLRRKPSKTPSEPAVPTDIEEDHIVEVVPEQHKVTSPRLQSVYLSPSERNLYLASLAGFDIPTPSLPLWSEPAPRLPEMSYPTPIPTPMLPNIPSPKPRRPRLSGLTPVSFGPRGHALLTLSGNGELRFVGFNKETILAAEKHLSSWHLGVEGRSRLPEDGGVWRIVLKGRVWRVKGNKELQTIEMLLALFTLLGQHGWTAVGPMVAGLGKHEFQNIIFANGSPHAPVYVALSLPLPDRISIIYPPDGVSGKLIEPVRNAILEASPPIDKTSSFTAFKEAAKRTSQSSVRRSSASRSSTDTGGSGATGDSESTKNSVRDPTTVIKLEGWVHPNVYRFWLAGMSRWSISKSVILKHQPPLMLEILTTLSAQHFELAASVPLSPRIPGRDLLIFATTPESNISSLDPLLSTPRARPTTIRENLPDEPLMFSYDGPSSHPDSDGEMPPPNILSTLDFGSDPPTSRYATPDSGAGRSREREQTIEAALTSAGSGGFDMPGGFKPLELGSLPQAVDMSARPSIDTIKSWATTVNTSQVNSPGRPCSPVLTPRSSLDPLAWGAQRKRAGTPVAMVREGSHSPEPPSSFEARRRPQPISPLVYNAVGSAPDLQHVTVSDLTRQASDSSRSSRTTLESSVQSHGSYRWEREGWPAAREPGHGSEHRQQRGSERGHSERRQSRDYPERRESLQNREPREHRDVRDLRERERQERRHSRHVSNGSSSSRDTRDKGKARANGTPTPEPSGPSREPNRTPGSRRTRTSIVMSENAS